MLHCLAKGPERLRELPEHIAALGRECNATSPPMDEHVNDDHIQTSLAGTIGSETHVDRKAMFGAKQLTECQLRPAVHQLTIRLLKPVLALQFLLH